MISVSKIVNFNQVNKIKSTSHVRISWEKYVNNKSVLQCLNCQKFGHSIVNCHKKPKCVKCTGNHRTGDCNKDEDEPPQCTNCEGAHPANYAGCRKFQEAVRKMTKKKSSSKLTKITSKTNHLGLNTNSFEIDKENFPTLNKISSKVNNPTSANSIATYSQIANRVLKPSQTSIDNLIWFNELLIEIDKLISCCNISALLQNIKRLNEVMQQSTNTNDQLLALINVMSTNCGNGD